MATYRFYALKIKGEANIPDYVQLRDEDFRLICYYRPGRIKKLANGIQDPKLLKKIDEAVQAIPFGKLTLIEVSDDSRCDLS